MNIGYLSAVKDRESESLTDSFAHEDVMSVNTYRSNVARLRKEEADLQKKLGDERKKIAKLQGEISSIQRSITKSTSSSTLQSKQRQIVSKTNDLAQAQAKVAEISKKITDKINDLNRNLQNLEKAEVDERKKQETTDKRRRDEELKHVQAVTRETEKQAQLHSQMQYRPYVVDWSRIPMKIKVVFFAANPLDQDQLRLDEEIRAITEKIRMSDYRDSVELISRWAVRPNDLLQALNEHEPHIIHFSGHGAKQGIAFVDPSGDGNTKVVTFDAIVQLINTMSANVQLVLFNTCVSSEQAQAVTQYVPLSIGMKDEIGDDAARVFAAHFYSAIGFGKSVRNAFEQAKTSLMLDGIPEEDTPELYCAQGVDANQIVLVKSDGILR